MGAARIFIALLFMTALVGTTNATTLDFENVGIANSTYPQSPLGFQDKGYQFSSNVAVMDVSDGSSGSNYGPAYSGKFVALNNYSVGDVFITRTDGGSFDFNGMAVFNSIYSSMGYVVVGGYKNGQWQQDVAVLTDGSRLWTQIDVTFRGVDEIKISRLSGGLIFFDDVLVSSVPEPETWMMFVLGLTALFLSKKSSKESLARWLGIFTAALPSARPASLLPRCWLAKPDTNGPAR